TTAGILHDQLAALGGDLIVTALERMALGTLSATPQPDSGVLMAAKIDKAEAHIDFNRPNTAVLRHIHGLSPFPGAWFAHGGDRIKVLEAERTEGRGVPGTLLDDRLTVACAQGAVRLRVVQRAGKGPMSADVFLRGYALPKATALA
ncbi:MAG: methionyl-tRNA formyltransferase, partial [Rhodospirillaceae bacterium]|nr:methionyl-tRNA formyltransferase [Rhodospirillaceae bacterium]